MKTKTSILKDFFGDVAACFKREEIRYVSIPQVVYLYDTITAMPTHDGGYNLFLRRRGMMKPERFATVPAGKNIQVVMQTAMRNLSRPVKVLNFDPDKQEVKT